MMQYDFVNMQDSYVLKRDLPMSTCDFINLIPVCKHDYVAW